MLNLEPVPPHTTETGFAARVGAAGRPLTMRFARPPEAADELAALIAISNTTQQQAAAAAASLAH